MSEIGSQQLLAKIGEQQLEIDALKKCLEYRGEQLAEVVLRLICVGGPLNDNMLGFDSEQRKYLHRILEIAERTP